MAGKRASRVTEVLQIGDRRIPVSNLDKPMYPVDSFTKGQVIDYYIRVSPYLLPHLQSRPVTLKRYPNGVGAAHFYEKNAPSFTPEWVKTFPVPRRTGGPDIRYILIDDLATLVWSANLANIEIHPFLHRVPAIDVPQYIVFDLDPGEGAGILECTEVAFLLKGLLDHVELKSFPKVSGSKGLQIYAPLNTAVRYAASQPFAKAVAQLLERQHPKLIVSDMAKSARANKVFIDWSQNSDFKTTVGVYSMRAKRQHPFVSMPVSWEELEAASSKKDSVALYWQPPAALERLEKVGDLFAPVLKLKQKLPVKLASLETYTKKRDLARASEPDRSRQGGRRRFVIQKHAARQLHYDFRLEMHDVLKSWAVPKGVPYAPDEKRLAMATEDHPIEYLDFEGIIPPGQYGGGTVMVWDIGSYYILEGNYHKGSLRIFLDGKKLNGEWLLTKDGRKGANAWSLVKTASAVKAITGKKDDSSALTGRSMAQIAASQDRTWQSNRASGEMPDLSRLPAAKMEFIEPMKAKLAAELPEGEAWQYEIKLDGYRAEALRASSGVQLLSRNNKSLASRFSGIAKACERLPEGTICDGEVVALDEDGRPSFNLLQNWHTSKVPIVYYVFDLLAYKGKSLLGMPLIERGRVLSEALNGIVDPIRLLGVLHAHPSALIGAAREQHIEGFIAKRANSTYEPGQRSGAWVKFKVNQGQELVVGGYVPGGKHHFESLLVGYYEGKKLVFIGKLRNGFTPKSREEVFARFEGLESEVCPFANLPEPKSARRGEALTAEVMKKCRWLKPDVVIQAEFTDWTEADHLRHSRFAGLREDKEAREVIHERPFSGSLR